MKMKTKTKATFDRLEKEIRKLSPERQAALLEQLRTDQAGEIINQDPDLKTVTLPEITRIYGVSQRSLLRYVAAGKLKAVLFGRKYVVTLRSLKNFFAEGGE